MILLISEPTEKDIELVNRILADKTITVFEIPNEPKAAVAPAGEWISAAQFQSLMEAKGFKCQHSISRKNLADKYDIPYEKRGRELWFRNLLSKVPQKAITMFVIAMSCFSDQLQNVLDFAM